MTRLTKQREELLKQWASTQYIGTSNAIMELLAEINALRVDLKRLRQASDDLIEIIDEPDDDNDSYEAMAYRKLYKIISCEPGTFKPLAETEKEGQYVCWHCGKELIGHQLCQECAQKCVEKAKKNETDKRT